MISNIHHRIHSHASRRMMIIRATCDSGSSSNRSALRWFSNNRSTSSGGKGPQPRKRFYKNVGVIEVTPPWESIIDEKSSNNSNKTIDNPISAGVDGTQSASGVIGHITQDPQQQEHLFKQRLIPRCTTTILDDWDIHHCNNDNTSSSSSSSSSNNSFQQSLRPPEKWYSITLDNRTLRTPVGQVLSVPSKLLAYSIAAEWDSQIQQIRPVQMPLMTLTCTTLDQTILHIEHYQNTALQFLPTDTTCYWADPTEDRALHRHQESAWKELHDFIEQELEEKPAMAMGAQEGMLLSRRRRHNSSDFDDNNNNPQTRGLPHPPSLYDKCVEWTKNLDAWHLTALNSIAAETKSFLVAYAVLHPESPFSSLNDNTTTKNAISKAIRAARVEEEFQIESWGLVEGQHDYDRLNCSVQVRSAKLLAMAVLEH